MSTDNIAAIERLMDAAYANQHTGIDYIDLSDPAARAATGAALRLAWFVTADAANRALSLMLAADAAGPGSVAYQQAVGAWAALREAAEWLEERYREVNLERV